MSSPPEEEVLLRPEEIPRATHGPKNELTPSQVRTMREDLARDFPRLDPSMRDFLIFMHSRGASFPTLGEDGEPRVKLPDQLTPMKRTASDAELSSESKL